MLNSLKNNAHFLYLSLLSILLVTANAGKSNVHPVIKSTCEATLYPELCISSIATTLSSSSIKISVKDVIIASLNQTIANIQQNYRAIQKISSNPNSIPTNHEKLALQDCLQVMNDSLAELHKSSLELMDGQDQFKNYSVFRRKEDARTLISAAMTNQETCLDGFSRNKKAENFRTKLLEHKLMNVFHLCSNVLTMVNNNFTAVNEDDTRYHEKSEWPYWLSIEDRRLLQAAGGVAPDVTVAADGSGNYRTIGAAVAAAPAGSGKRYIIKIKAGVYRENVEVPKGKTNLMFIGDGQRNTIVTARRNVKEGGTTFNSATVAVAGDGFLARDITFQNTAGPEGEQAVALRVNADFAAFYKCNMLAYQDTLYTHSLRQFYHSCIIVGTVDFIFGNAAVVFQNCDIHARKPGPNQKNMVTAQGRDDPNQNTGIVIQRCRIGATGDLQAEKDKFPTYLGRPWKQYSRTVIMLSEISDIINPAGWFEWNGNFALDTLYYAEYQNTGAGARTTNRVKWKGYKVITNAAEAQAFTPGRFISGGSWLGSTGFPYTLGL